MTENKSIKADDLPFGPRQFKKDPIVTAQYIQHVFHAAADSGVDPAWKLRWARQTCGTCYAKTCRGCEELIVVQYNAPRPNDPYIVHGQAWHHDCYQQYRNQYAWLLRQQRLQKRYEREHPKKAIINARRRMQRAAKTAEKKRKREEERAEVDEVD